MAAGKAIDMPASAVDDAVRSDLLKFADVILASFEQIKTHRAGFSKPILNIVRSVHTGRDCYKKNAPQRDRKGLDGRCHMPAVKILFRREKK
ncbi:hypothetical protein [Ochrobactrum vermis]|nr:hypothetical protein [Ochrobactrum vermis]PQZ29441.1 hypothetical protein CQZ93_04075 [Ochrobactrum vermis]